MVCGMCVMLVYTISISILCVLSVFFVEGPVVVLLNLSIRYMIKFEKGGEDKQYRQVFVK